MKKCLHAKLAWKFLSNDTLWMQFVRSKIKQNTVDYDSFIWKSINSAVHKLRRESFWDFGNGSTQIQHAAEWYSSPPPSTVADLTIREIKSDSRILQALHDSPLRPLAIHIRDTTLTDYSPSLFWKGSPHGRFCTKTYLRRCSIRLQSPTPFLLVWQPWIPPKFSILVWRLLHNAIASDEAVSSKGIQMASSCHCCVMPSQETTDHIFFKGDVAVATWNIFGSACSAPRPTNSQDFLRDWISPSKHKIFTNRLTALVGACIIWELWRCRNEARWNGNKIDPIRPVRLWISQLACSVRKFKYRGNYEPICHNLSIPTPGSPYSARFWKPGPCGLTATCSVIGSDPHLTCSIIIRSASGIFVMGLSRPSTPSTFLQSLLQSISSIPASILLDISCFQSHHPDIRCVAQHSAHWSDIRAWRLLQEITNSAEFSHISLEASRASTALAWSGCPTSTSEIELLPLSVRLAIALDLSITSP